jgi:hypothetical protein
MKNYRYTTGEVKKYRNSLIITHYYFCKNFKEIKNKWKINDKKLDKLIFNCSDLDLELYRNKNFSENDLIYLTNFFSS